LYAYAANTPINAIDPDGHLVIFVAGQNSGNGRSRSYWQGQIEYNIDGGFQNFRSNVDFAQSAVNHFRDGHVKFYDGALGGWDNTKNIFSNNNNLSFSNRVNAGHEQGKIDVAAIIQSLKRTNGVITESIKIIAHSMGAAYAQGLVTAIVEYAQAHPEECQGLSITQYDFAGYQPNKLSAISGVPLFEYDNSHGDYVVAYGPGSRQGKIRGRQEKGSNDNVNPDGGHSIVDFMDAISTLQEGTYKFVNGQFVKQEDKKP
jgi:hypothetical protein